VEFVGALDVFGACQGDGVFIAGAPFSRHEVVPVLPLVKVRSLGHPALGTGKNLADRADQFLLPGVVFLHHDAIEVVVIRAVIPLLVEQPFFAIGIVKERGVDPAGVEVTGSVQGPSIDGAVTR
jgi:hypothetical protein